MNETHHNCGDGITISQYSLYCLYYTPHTTSHHMLFLSHHIWPKFLIVCLVSSIVFLCMYCTTTTCQCIDCISYWNKSSVLLCRLNRPACSLARLCPLLSLNSRSAAPSLLRISSCCPYTLSLVFIYFIPVSNTFLLFLYELLRLYKYLSLLTKKN